MKIMFHKLYTKDDKVTVSFDKGYTNFTYENNDVRDTGIPIPLFDCQDLGDIELNGQTSMAYKVRPTYSDEQAARFKEETTFEIVLVSDLNSFIATKSPNTADSAYKVQVVGLNTQADYNLFYSVMSTAGVYFDLRPTHVNKEAYESVNLQSVSYIVQQPKYN